MNEEIGCVPLTDTTRSDDMMEELYKGMRVLRDLPEVLQILYARLDEILARQLGIISAQKNVIGDDYVQIFQRTVLDQVAAWKKELPDMGKDKGMELITEFNNEDISHLERLIPEKYGGTRESEIHLMHPEYSKIHNNLNKE